MDATATKLTSSTLTARRRCPPLLVFADDWGRHPSSPQHLIAQLLPDMQVTWVNTIGLRRPRLDWHTLQRVAGKLSQWYRPRASQTPLPHNLTVVAPRMWPSYRHGWERALNRRLLLSQLRPIVEAMNEPPVVISTLPIVADLVGELPVAKWIYYCVDDFSVWPGLDSETLAALDRHWISRADRIVCVSHNLRERMRSLGRDADLLMHGIDLAHWPGNQHIGGGPRMLDAAQNTWPQPWAVFWGLIDSRMNLAWLQTLNDTMTHGTIVLAGPCELPRSAFAGMNRVHLLPPLPYSQMPALSQYADALIMPYADLPVTRAMQPLKLLEYLATGKPVVTSPLPAVQPWSDCLDMAHNADEFAAHVIRRLEFGACASQSRARHRLAAESWSHKAESLRHIIDDTARQR